MRPVPLYVRLTLLLLFSGAAARPDQREEASRQILSRLSQLTDTPRDIETLAEISRLRSELGSEIVSQRVLEFVAAGLLLHDRLDIYRELAPLLSGREELETALTQPCRRCVGQGGHSPPCIACGGNGRHRQCNGQGYHLVGGGFGRPASRQRCTGCNASGACPSCQGRGTSVRRGCPECAGVGATINRAPLLPYYQQTRDMLRNELMEAIILRSVVIIDGDQGGRGSGFVSRFSGGIYVVSNAHVFIGNDTVTLRTVEGRRLAFNGIYMSKERDLMLYSLEDSSGLEPLEVIGGMMDLRIGTPLVVYGNSQGAGVATYLTGEIQAVGPSEFETNAGFVQGNSGSPVIVNGRVAGVATYATRFNSNWVAAGTRFTNVRRFATRLDNTSLEDFVAVDLEQYRVQNRSLRALTQINRRTADLLSNHQFERVGTDFRDLLEEALVQTESFEDLGSYMMRDQMSRQIELARVLLNLMDQIDVVRAEVRMMAERAAERRHEIRSVVGAVMEEQRRGRFGDAYWAHGTFPTRLFSPVSWEILDSSVRGIHASVPVLVESSNRGGIPIRRTWTFRLVFTQAGWRLLEIAE